MGAALKNKRLPYFIEGENEMKLIRFAVLAVTFLALAAVSEAGVYRHVAKPVAKAGAKVVKVVVVGSYKVAKAVVY
jgi:hypothetical protein